MHASVVGQANEGMLLTCRSAARIFEGLTKGCRPIPVQTIVRQMHLMQAITNAGYIAPGAQLASCGH